MTRGGIFLCAAGAALLVPSVYRSTTGKLPPVTATPLATVANSAGAAPSASAGSVGRRHLLLVASSGSSAVAAANLRLWPAAAAELSPALGPVEPSPEDLNLLRTAFSRLAVDPRQPGARAELEAGEIAFGQAIARWEGPLRGTTGDRVQLRLGRAQTRITINDITGGRLPEKAEAAVQDFNEVVRIMEKEDSGAKGTFNYPDVFVRRALAKEEIAYGRRDQTMWAAAAEDYSRAIQMWRDGSLGPDQGVGLGVNPMVLNFRGNALSQLGRFEEAFADYHEATDIFVKDRQLRQASLSRSNEGLALFGAGRANEALSVMEAVARRDPDLADPHVVLAAVYWSQVKIGRAEEQWQLACEKSEGGCSQYKDLAWVQDIRRWPETLVSKLRTFFRRETPLAATGATSSVGAA